MVFVLRMSEIVEIGGICVCLHYVGTSNTVTSRYAKDLDLVWVFDRIGRKFEAVLSHKPCSSTCCFFFVGLKPFRPTRSDTSFPYLRVH